MPTMAMPNRAASEDGSGTPCAPCTEMGLKLDPTVTGIVPPIRPSNHACGSGDGPAYMKDPPIGVMVTSDGKPSKSNVRRKLVWLGKRLFSPKEANEKELGIDEVAAGGIWMRNKKSWLFQR